MSRLSIAVLALAASAPALTAQTTLTRTGGQIGSTLRYDMQGDPGEAYALFPSPSGGPTPVSTFNPGDPRELSVGLGNQTLWTLGILDGSGAASRTYNLPPEPALQGLVAYAQFITFTTKPITVDDISNPTSFVFAQSGTSHLTVGEMTRDASSATLTELADGNVLVAGGSKTSQLGEPIINRNLAIFEAQTQTFRSTINMIDQRVLHTATRLDDGRVLLLGGSDDANVIQATGEIFDPVTETVSAILPMGVARAGHTATLLEDGRVFVAGGTSQFDFADPFGALGAIHRSTAIYDPDTNTWASGPNLPRPRVLHAATRLADGRVLIGGGIDVVTIIVPIPGFTSDCRAFDPVSGNLQNVADFSGGRALHTQLLLSDGSVLLAGGTDGNLLSQVFTPLASCRRYRPGTNTWSNVGSMASARALGAELVQRGSSVFAIGGMSSIDLTTLSGTPVTDVETATLESLTWSSAGSMQSARPASASVAIEGGDRILTIGSTTVGVDLTAEIFVP